jgi:hypothetical protein
MGFGWCLRRLLLAISPSNDVCVSFPATSLPPPLSFIQAVRSSTAAKAVKYNGE